MSEKKLLTVFMEKMATDEGFALKVAAVESPEALVALAKSVGFALTLEQATAGLSKVQELLAEGRTLGDDESLEGIAGGCCKPCEKGVCE